MKIAEMMSKDVHTVDPRTDFETLLCKMACLPFRQLYVVGDDSRLQGIISSYDLLKLMAPVYLDSNLAKALPEDRNLVMERFAAHRTKTALEVMNREFSYLRPGDQFLRADILVREKGVNILPVVDEDGKLVGEASRKDILRYLTQMCCGCRCPEQGEEG